VVEEFVVHPSGAFSEATFDLGVEFSRIDAVRVAIEVQNGLPGIRCSGSSCAHEFIDTAIYSEGRFEPFDPFHVYWVPSDDPEYDPNVMRAGFGYLVPNLTSDLRVVWPNPRTAGFDVRPPALSAQFLFDGRGQIAMQQVAEWFCFLNCTGSGRNVTAPDGVSSVRIIVEGVATPEPSTLALMLLTPTLLVVRPIRRVAVAFSWKDATRLNSLT
jgi:hypothetical protein